MSLLLRELTWLPLYNLYHQLTYLSSCRCDNQQHSLPCLWQESDGDIQCQSWHFFNDLMICVQPVKT